MDTFKERASYNYMYTQIIHVYVPSSGMKNKFYISVHCILIVLLHYTTKRNVVAFSVMDYWWGLDSFVQHEVIFCQMLLMFYH